MTGQELALDLLRYIGVTGFGPVDNDQKLNRPGVDDDDVRRALAAINSALKEIQLWGPQDLKFGERAAFFNDPTQLVLTVTMDGQTATATTTPPAWMLGCSALLAGDGDMNRIRDITGNQVSFLRGFRGASGSGVAATVYADCATLGPDIAAVVEPVVGSPNNRIELTKDLDRFEGYAKRYWQDVGNTLIETPTSVPGNPALAYVERRRAGDLFLRVTPMPGQKFNATFQAKLRAEQVDDDILDTEGGDDPEYEFTSLHGEEVPNILLPIARWKFFTHPALKNVETRGAVKAEYDEVMLKLRGGTALESSVSDNKVTYI